MATTAGTLVRFGAPVPAERESQRFQRLSMEYWLFPGSRALFFSFLLISFFFCPLPSRPVASFPIATALHNTTIASVAKTFSPLFFLFLFFPFSFLPLLLAPSLSLPRLAASFLPSLPHYPLSLFPPPRPPQDLPASSQTAAPLFAAHEYCLQSWPSLPIVTLTPTIAPRQ